MKQRKPKKVHYQLIQRNTEVGMPMYAMLDDLVAQHHDDLREARVVLSWCTSWKVNVDGQVVLGQCRRASDLDLELIPYDFIILLSREFWESFSVTFAQRLALLDHELCHAAVKHDADGEPVEDQRGRKVWRTRKHVIEEFPEVVERHGCYKHDLETFAQALARHRPQKIQEANQQAATLMAECEDCSGTGYRPVITDGGEAVTPCFCKQQAAQIRAQAEATL